MKVCLPKKKISFLGMEKNEFPAIEDIIFAYD